MGDPVEAAKKKAAFAAVDEYIADGQVVGIGSGSTVVYAVERLAERVQKEKLNVHCLPTSFQSKQLIRQHKLPLSDLEAHPVIDVTIDGADEVDSQLNCIKGGGGCNTQEKIIAFNSKTFVVVADYRKDSEVLGTQWKKGVPIEVIPMAYNPLSLKFKELGGTPTLRMAKSKAGPLVTDNGNFIIDVDVGDEAPTFGSIKDPAALESKLAVLPGVVTTGLFINMAVKAFIGLEDGSIITKTPK